MDLLIGGSARALATAEEERMPRLVHAARFAALLVAAVLALPRPIAFAAESPVRGLHLGFDTTGVRVQGNGWLVTGVAGQALQLDGIASHVVVPAAEVPPLAGSFTVEGWVALGAYPFNDGPLLQQQDGESVGFFLGVGDRGQVRFDVATGGHVAAGGRRLSLASAEHLPLRQWAHVAGVFEEGKGTALYVNGQPAGVAGGTGPFVQATRSDLWIGRNAYETEQSAPVGHDRQQPTRILLDAVLDELRITPGAKTATDVAAAYAQTKPAGAPPLEARALPKLPPGPGGFGAFYTRLRYYEGWDASWRVADEPDVVVRFDQAPYWFAFWRGTSYIPHWVTENGIWYDNEFVETFPPGMVGSAEPMSDKQCRYSHVRILESGEVRRHVSIYPWWNHWPTAFEPSNGRNALAADRASHSSLTHMRWKEIAKTRDAVTKVHLEGMSDAGVAELASLARSWESPAVLKIESPGYSGGDYDPGERAWIVEHSAAATEPLALTLAARPASPVENVALIVKGWGDGGAALTLEGREVASGKDFRVGHRRRLEATDLVVFATAHAASPLRLVLTRR